MKENRKTLLILVVLSACIFLPTVSTKPLAQQDITAVIKEVFEQTSVTYLWLSPIVHVFTIMLLAVLYWYGSRVGRAIDAFFGILYIFIAFSNHIAMTENYGLVVIMGNLVPILIVGFFWLWETYHPQNMYVFEKLPMWRYWVLPFAFLAFWFPINAQLKPDFSPLLLLTSYFGVQYCPTTPVVVAILTLIYPKVNVYVLRVTSFVGFLIGIFNVMSFFVMPGYTLWNLFLHTPLILVSMYGLIIPILVKKKE
jgi:hypothetical protein